MVQPHGAERVLEVLKRANMGPSQGVLAARCLVARKDQTPASPCGRLISAALARPSVSGAGIAHEERLEKESRQTHIPVAAATASLWLWLWLWQSPGKAARRIAG
jgi:hypothetical protein